MKLRLPDIQTSANVLRPQWYSNVSIGWQKHRPTTQLENTLLVFKYTQMSSTTHKHFK